MFLKKIYSFIFFKITCVVFNSWSMDNPLFTLVGTNRQVTIKDIFSAINDQKDEDYKLIEDYLKAGFDANLTNDLGSTMLMCAAFCHNTKILKLLLTQKNIDINAQGYSNQTALIKAIHTGVEENIQLLLQHKNIDINIQCKHFGHTALMYLLDLYTKDLIPFICTLIRLGANVDRRTLSVLIEKHTMAKNWGNLDEFTQVLFSRRDQDTYECFEKIRKLLYLILFFEQENTDQQIKIFSNQTLEIENRQILFCWFFNRALNNKYGNSPNLKTLFKMYEKSLFSELQENCEKKKLTKFKKLYYLNKFELFDINIQYNI